MAAPATTYPEYPDQSYPQANYPQQQQPYYQPPAPQYPQPAQQPYPGQVAYVGQPNPGYSTPAGNEQHMQQQQAVIINASIPTVVAQYTQPFQSSYSTHIAFACIVFWCCGWLFGAIAFFLALSAQSNQPSDPEAARRLGRASLGVSIAGLAVGIVTIIALSVGLSLAAAATATKSSTCCSYGYCYTC